LIIEGWEDLKVKELDLFVHLYQRETEVGFVVGYITIYDERVVKKSCQRSRKQERERERERERELSIRERVKFDWGQLKVWSL
jgi:hypothetical protein